MRKQVKDSLNELFEHAQLQERQSRRNKQILPAAVTLAILCLTFVFIASQWGSKAPSKHLANTEETSIFHLKNSYIGKSIVSFDIAKHVIPEAQIKSYELHTKEAPYGLTIYLLEPLADALKYKYAFYLFTLVQNGSYVIFDWNGEQWRMDRDVIEQAEAISFASINEESELLTSYYQSVIHFIDMPQIQTVADHVYKVFFNFRLAGEPYKTTMVEAPDYAFYLDEQQYFLWISEEEAFFIDAQSPLLIQRVIGKPYEEVRQFLEREA